MTLLMMLLTFTTILLIQLNHPLFIALSISLTALVLATFMYLYLKLSWLSYIFFLIFLGGILVLFLYISTMTPNSPASSLSFSPMLILIPFLLLINTFIPSLNLPLQPLIKLLFSLPFISITIMLTFFLLITLTIVTKLAKLSVGPLRSIVYDKTNPSKSPIMKNY